MISIQQHLAKNAEFIAQGTETVLAQIMVEPHHEYLLRTGKKLGDWVDYSRTTVEGYLNYREPGMRAVDWLTKEEINMDSHFDKYSKPLDAAVELTAMVSLARKAREALQDEHEGNFRENILELEEAAKRLADFVRGM